MHRMRTRCGMRCSTRQWTGVVGMAMGGDIPVAVTLGMDRSRCRMMMGSGLRTWLRTRRRWELCTVTRGMAVIVSMSIGMRIAVSIAIELVVTVLVVIHSIGIGVLIFVS